MARIFISYRRRDSAYVAASLSEKLQQHFGDDSVFYDIDNIPLGVDFREHIGSAVGQCDVLLVIIGEEWITAADKTGARRIDNAGDYVRIEIESALKRDIPVIPVLVDEAQMPPANDLPEPIREIVYRNAAEIRAGSDFRQHIERLIHGLERLFEAAQKKNPTGAPPAPVRKPKAATEKPEKSLPVETKSPAPPREETIKPQKETLDKQLSANLVVRRIIGDFTDGYLFLQGGIPENKLNNAIQAYAPGASREAVLLLYDNTFLGGAKDGLLMTDDAIYWRNGFAASGGMRYFADIKNVTYSLGILSCDIYIDGYVIQTNMGATAKLVKIFAEIILNLAPSVRATALDENREKTETKLIVTSDDGTCRISVPSSWSKQSHLNLQATLQVANPAEELYAVIIGEPKSDFPALTTLDAYVDVVRENMRFKLENPQYFSPVPTTIGGFNAREFEIDGIFSGNNVRYLYGVLETTRKFYQVMTLTLAARYEENKPIMLEVIQSFKEIG
jgi:hypothetical protein